MGLTQEHMAEKRFQVNSSEHDQFLRRVDGTSGVRVDAARLSLTPPVGTSTKNNQSALIDLTTYPPKVSLSPPERAYDPTPYHYPAKRFLDVLLAVLILAVVSPVMLMLALVVLVSSGRPIFYSHHRVGRYGRHFQCHKFRTMVTDADARLQALLLQDADARAEFAASQKLQRDPRVTAVGQFLRRTSVDELPQLLNVLRGEMSIVGPRPVTSNELARYGWAAEEYLAVRPGITGLWQVSGRSDVTYEDRVRLDVAYVRNMSMAFDLRLLIRTALVVLRRSAAY